jgi:outer membrane protein
MEKYVKKYMTINKMMRFICSISFLYLAIAVPAQASKGSIAHADFNAIVQALPESKKVSDSLAALWNIYQQRIEALQKEADKQKESLERERMLLEPAVLAMRERQAEEMMSQARQAKEQAKMMVKSREQELLHPIIKKIKQAIGTFSEKHNIEYVFDVNEPTTIYATPKNDITQEIIKLLTQ